LIHFVNAFGGHFKRAVFSKCKFIKNQKRRPAMAANARPLSPKEVVKKKINSIPDAVFEAFNELIAKDFNGAFAIVKQKEVVKLLVEKGLKEKEIYENHWLDVEDVYRKAGWKVEYDKPAYNESYDAYFEFRPRGKK
jgi:hypothetical protein